MLPKIKRFTKEAPCSKGTIWSCFREGREFVKVGIAVAHSIIGVNTPRTMISKGRLVRYEEGNIEYYELTSEGRVWLIEGVKRCIQKHPEKAAAFKYPPRGS